MSSELSSTSSTSLGKKSRGRTEQMETIQVDEGKSRRRTKSLRILTIISALIIPVLLLAYSFLFLYTFYALNNTTSFFPWSWNVLYVSSGPSMISFTSALRYPFF